MNSCIIIICLATILLIICSCVSIKEGLSLSQFPIPTCSTCKSCKFYTCGKCGYIYQEQNKEGQPCDCGGFTVYKTPLADSCYNKVLAGRPGLRPADCEGFSCSDNSKPPVKGSCQSCQKNQYTCLQASGTFDSGTTWLRNLPCPPPFPPVLPGIELVAQKQVLHTSELDVYKHLQAGGLIVGSNDGAVADYAIKKLIEATQSGGNQGYPDFYYISGPVLIMNKVGDKYYWMTDYPIKYNPENFGKYVNSSSDWNIAKTAYKHGLRLLESNAPIFFFSNSPVLQTQLQKVPWTCLPTGHPQSNTDYYYPGCDNKSCLWGPDYGSGNWLMRV